MTDTLGACLIANDDIPFNGLALDIFNRRVDGKSWKEIADEFGLGSPGKARTTFTKLTGITDYKIKGQDLINLAKGGVDPKLTMPIVEKQAAKAAAKSKKIDTDIDAGKTPEPDPEPPAPSKTVEALEAKIKKLEAELKEAAETAYKTNLVEDHKKKTDKWAELYKAKNELEELKDATGINPLEKQIANWVKKEPQPPAIGSPDQAWADWNEKLLDWKAKKPGSVVPETIVPPGAPPPAASVLDVLGTPGKLKPDPNWLVTEDSVDELKAVWQLHNEGQGYAAIVSKTGVPIPDIDRIIWNNLLDKYDNDIWKAYNSKVGSQEGFNAVKQMVFDLRKSGKTIQEITDMTGVDKKVVKAIAEDKWKLPPAGSMNYYTPPDPYNPYGSTPQPWEGKYPWKEADEFPILTPEEMVKAGHTQTIEQEVKDSLRAYTGSTYMDINGYLRGQNTSASAKRHVERMDKGMFLTTRPMTVTRGMGRSGFDMGNLSDDAIDNLAGTVVRDRGYMSTAIKEVFDNEIRFVLECPVGTRGHWVAGFSNHGHEQEYLLGRGTRVMVTKVEKDPRAHYSKKWIVYGRVIP